MKLLEKIKLLFRKPKGRIKDVTLVNLLVIKLLVPQVKVRVSGNNIPL